MRASLASIILAIATMAVAAPAHAQARADIYFGYTSSRVASAIDCQRFDGNGGGQFNKDSGVCFLKGYRVNVITFANTRQQASWMSKARAGFGPNFWWGWSPGVVIVAKNGNKAAAQTGAFAVDGKTMHG